MYFTTFMEYATMYAKASQEGEKCVILCWLNLGNAYPVTGMIQRIHLSDLWTEDPHGEDSFVGRNAVLGYQSHYAVVKNKGGLQYVPCKQQEEAKEAKVYDELVCFQHAQVLIQYIILVKPKA